jgi:hypothetical protein
MIEGVFLTVVAGNLLSFTASLVQTSYHTAFSVAQNVLNVFDKRRRLVLGHCRRQMEPPVDLIVLEERRAPIEKVDGVPLRQTPPLVQGPFLKSPAGLILHVHVEARILVIALQCEAHFFTGH